MRHWSANATLFRPKALLARIVSRDRQDSFCVHQDFGAHNYLQGRPIQYLDIG
jgi:hypothetical protein